MAVHGFRMVPMRISRTRRQNESGRFWVRSLTGIIRDCTASVVDRKKQSVGQETSLENVRDCEECGESVGGVGNMTDCVRARRVAADI